MNLGGDVETTYVEGEAESSRILSTVCSFRSLNNFSF